MPAAMDESLELRPHWLTLAALLYVTAMGLLVAATVWLTSKTNDGGWLVASAGLLVGVLALAMAVRMRLILTPSGYRFRALWRGRLGSWTAIEAFYPVIPPSGVYWMPRVGPPMPRTSWEWLMAINASGYRHLPLFGPSRAYMVETLNAWLERFAPNRPSF